MITILSVAGSDNSSGAGIQADIKTCLSLNAYCLTAVTNVTSQNSNSVHRVFSLPSNLVISQINALLDDYKIDLPLFELYLPLNWKIRSDRCQGIKIPRVRVQEYLMWT